MRKLSRTQRLLVALFLVSLFFAYSLWGPAPSPRRVGRAARLPATANGQVAVTSPVAKLPPAVTGEIDFRRYASLASSGLFSETRLVPPTPVIKSGPVLPPPPFNRTPSPPPPPRIDLAGWSYAGLVTLDGTPVAIVQNEATKASEFLPLGSAFLGATVDRFDGEAIHFRAGPTRESLKRPADFSIIPLTNAATANPGGPPKPQPR